MQKFRVVFIGIMMLMLMTACETDSQVEPDPASPSDTGSSIESTPEVEEASSGEILFHRSYEEVGFACASCHFVTESRLIGPGLANIMGRVEGYDLDMTIEEYIIESITHPQNYIVPADPAYPENVMPDSYADIFTEEELNDLVEYILSF